VHIITSFAPVAALLVARIVYGEQLSNLQHIGVALSITVTIMLASGIH
jgi:multidrug transporter EmrE-like cation transporter